MSWSISLEENARRGGWRTRAHLGLCAVALVLAHALFWSPALRADAVAELAEQARTHNAEILKGQAELRAALARVPQVRALPDPQVQLELMGDDAVSGEQTVRVVQGFPWPGTLGQRETQASLQARAYWHEVQSMELRVVSRIRAIAAEYAYMRREAGLIRQNLELYRKQEDFLEQTARAGGDVSDLVRVEVQASLLADDLAKLEEAQLREAAELEALVGAPIPPEVLARLAVPDKRPPVGDPEALAQQLAVRNPMLQALASRIEAARAGVELARLESHPEFMVTGGYRRKAEPGMGGSSSGDYMNEALVMFSVTVPLWREKNRGMRAESAAMLEMAVQEHEAAARMLRAQLQVLLSRGRDAARRATLYSERILPKAQQAHEAVEAAYRSGTASLLDLLETRRALLEAQTAHWRSLADLHINQAEIDALYGTSIRPPEL